RQRLVDERLIACCDALDDAGCERTVEMPRRAGVVQRDAAAFVLQHLFMHQTHHRGQVHAMLAGTAVAPPQLDEFLMPSDAPLRRAEMAALGWDEAAVYGH
ncbi:MAG: damage-inducible protein DinB, partial [Rubrivivax sp.]|nr:damage-inducible protein DinB [Rubrivivax sp.]